MFSAKMGFFSARNSSMSPSGWEQLGTTLSGTETGDSFGSSVCIGGQGSGTVIAISAPAPDSTSKGGAVRVYQWDGLSWSQRGDAIEGSTHTVSGALRSEEVGLAIALCRDGTSLAVSNRSSVRPKVSVYRWSGSSWTQVGTGGIPFFSNSLAISDSGNVVACGWFGFSSDGVVFKGAARVYEWDGSAWVQKGQELQGQYQNDRFGWSVCLSADGNTIAVGAHSTYWGDGFVSVYRWSGANWSLVGRVGRQAGTPTNPDSSTTGDFSGEAVSLSADGSLLAVGAPMYSSWSTGVVGRVKVYNIQSEGVTQRGDDLYYPASNQEDDFGIAVSLSDDGNMLAVTDYRVVSYNDRRRRIRTYLWSGGAWTQYGEAILGESSEDWCDDGSFISGKAASSKGTLNGDGAILAVGAACGDGDATDSGVVRVYGYGNPMRPPERAEKVLALSWTLSVLDVGSLADPTIGFSSSASNDRGFIYVMKDSLGSHLGYFSANGSFWVAVPLPGASFFQSSSVRKYKLFGFGDHFYALITTDESGSDVDKLYRAVGGVAMEWQEFDTPSNPDRQAGQSVGGWRNFIRAGTSSSPRYFLFGHGGSCAYSSDLSSWTIMAMPWVDTWDKSASIGNKIVVVGDGTRAAFCDIFGATPFFSQESLNLLGSPQECWGLSDDGTNFIAMSE